MPKADEIDIVERLRQASIRCKPKHIVVVPYEDIQDAIAEIARLRRLLRQTRLEDND